MRSHYCLTVLLLAGCQSLTGLPGSSPSFGCKAPDGVACTSVSGVHANLMANNLPSQRASRSDGATPVPAGTPLAALVPGEPLRREPRILRIWLAPWIDDDGTLHDQSYLYAQVDQGRWLIADIRQQLQQPRPRRASADDAPRPAPVTPSKPAQAARHKPLADVRASADAQAAARAAMQASQHERERP